jgi:hypothetical protein
MTPTCCCGFECGQNGAEGQHWGTFSGTASFSTSTVRSGARSFRANPTASTGSTLSTSGYFYNSTTRQIGRIYVRFTTLPSATTVLVNYGTVLGAGPRVTYQQSDSTVYAAVTGTLGASGVSVTTGQWYRIDFDFNVNTGGNDTCDVQVDGVACGQATAAGASASTSTIAIGVMNACTADVFFDDFISSQTGADYPIGAGYVNHFVCTSDGTHNVAGAGDFRRGTTATDITNATTTAFQLIDEVPLDDTTADTDDFISLFAPPNATDYVECVFGPAPGISTPTTGPRAVEVIAGIHQAGTGTGNMEIRLNDNGSMGTIYTATTVAGTTTIIYKRAHFADPPSAASVWNAAGDGGNGDFLDVRVRFGSPGAVDANPDQYLDCIMIEAEFAEVTEVSTDWMPGPFVQIPPTVRNVGY